MSTPRLQTACNRAHSSVSHEARRSGARFIVLSCEHAGNTVPQSYRHLFAAQPDVLSTHRGYDPGALAVALQLASSLAAPIHFTETTRLLVDTNRSADNDQVFSEFSITLTSAARQEILEQFYWPHRLSIETSLAAMIDAGHDVLHIALHSFVDELNGHRREFEIGVLFDPDRGEETKFAVQLLAAIEISGKNLRGVSNQPYLGTDDGLTTAMRKAFDCGRYLGIEIEMRQGLLASAAGRRAATDSLIQAIRHANRISGETLTG